MGREFLLARQESRALNTSVLPLPPGGSHVRRNAAVLVPDCSCAGRNLPQLPLGLVLLRNQQPLPASVASEGSGEGWWLRGPSSGFLKL